MDQPQYSRRIKDWPEDERPRERLQQHGEQRAAIGAESARLTSAPQIWAELSFKPLAAPRAPRAASAEEPWIVTVD